MSIINERQVEWALEDKAIVVLTQNGKEVKTGNIYDVREEIETMLEKEIGVFVSLQEDFDTEDLSYKVAVHSDAFEDCEEEEIDKFSDLGLTDWSESTTPILFNLLGIDVKFIHYIEK